MIYSLKSAPVSAEGKIPRRDIFQVKRWILTLIRAVCCMEISFSLGEFFSFIQHVMSQWSPVTLLPSMSYHLFFFFFSSKFFN